MSIPIEVRKSAQAGLQRQNAVDWDFEARHSLYDTTDKLLFGFFARTLACFLGTLSDKTHILMKQRAPLESLTLEED